MKFLIVALIMIVVGIAILNLQDETSSEPTLIETSTQTTTKVPKPATTTAEQGATVQETSTGTDVGMEYPDMDINNTGMRTDQNAKVFEISGENFKFDVSEMRVHEGDTVVVKFKSADGYHNWVIDEFDAHTEKVGTGNESQVTFVADRKGVFEYYCSVGSHRASGMVGKLIVE